MQDLNTHILEILPEQDAIVAELSGAIKNIRDLFSKIPFQPKLDAWGYRVLDDRAEKTGEDDSGKLKLSQSTVSMIAAAIMRANHGLQGNASSGFPWSHVHRENTVNDKNLDSRIDDSLKLLIDAWRSNGATGPKTTSTTYGNDDILSLSWHYDLFSSDQASQVDPKCSDVIGEIETLLVDRAAQYAKADSNYKAICEAFRDASTPIASDARIGDSSYILLRFARCLASLPSDKRDRGSDVRRAMSRAGKRFQSRLHDHLSLAEITDSRFDPAELAFCLEGLMHTKPEQVDYPLLDRAISVLTKAQAQSAYWRSETPIVIQQRGHVLFPIGVEVARSILNSIALFILPDSKQGALRDVQYGHLSLLTRYWAWLKTRQTTIERDGILLSGWHTEHINDPDLIHTWETSQILEFLISFRALLKFFVSNELLFLSRLDVRYPGKSTSWSEVVDAYEPYQSNPYNIYEQIGKDFVESRLSSTPVVPENWSMLLYGPPGTGKSTVAENLGDCLRVPVITVTVSDFLGEGESRMESRVKNMFTVIERQSGAVILFDEMDQFLLDRNSQLFREQQSVFQFLTPGMLTKFAKLRKSASVIFIIATNFEERIDPAIKRTGRIDKSYLVLPPDKKRRESIMSEIKACNAILEGAGEDDIAAIMEASCLLAYTDLKQLSSHSPKTVSDLVELLNGTVRNVQFSTIAARHKDSPTKGMEEEIKGLILLVGEAHQTSIASRASWSGGSDFLRFMETLPPGGALKTLYETFT